MQKPEYTDYTIIPYREKYRDDMFFIVLEAKDALGRVPRLNEDLLDVQGNYLATGDMFWLLNIFFEPFLQPLFALFGKQRISLDGFSPESV